MTLDGVVDWILHLLTTLPHDLELQLTTAPPLTCTIRKSPQHPLSRFKLAASSPAILWQRLSTVGILELDALKSPLKDGSPQTAPFPNRLPYRTDWVAPIIFLITLFQALCYKPEGRGIESR
jgi:hypothetical protein